MKKLIIVIILLLNVFACTENIKEYGVFIGSNKVEDIKNYNLIVIDAYYLDKEEIKELHQTNKKIYTYLNIGTIENFRKYYSEFKDDAFDIYEDWPEERWMDVSKSNWQDFILNKAKEYKALGVDGFFIDNTDVYSMYPSDQIYHGLVTILNELNTLGLDLMINGGDVFVRKAVDDIHIDAVNQETIFSKINFETHTLERNNKEDEAYYKEYVEYIKDHNIKVYLLEYTKKEEMIIEIENYCKKHDFLYYISPSIELNQSH